MLQWKEQGDKDTGGLKEPRKAHGCQPAKKQGPRLSVCEELNSDDNLTEFGSKFFPGASKKDHGPADALILAL